MGWEKTPDQLYAPVIGALERGRELPEWLNEQDAIDIIRSVAGDKAACILNYYSDRLQIEQIAA